MRNKLRGIETLARCVNFARAYRDALAAAWCAKKRSIVFALGTDLMRLRHLGRCAEA